MATPWTGAGVTGAAKFGVGYMLDFDPMIKQLDPSWCPLQAGGDPFYSVGLSDEGADQTLIQWQDETSLIGRTTSTALQVTAATELTVSAAERARIRVGNVIAVDDEKMLVTAYSTLNTNLVVTRAFAGTTAAQHANASIVMAVGDGTGEASALPNPVFRDRDIRKNNMQIFRDNLEVSGTQTAVGKYGIGNEFTKQLANRLRELPVQFEQAAMYGTPSGEGTDTRTMGGLASFVAPANIDAAGSAITEDRLINAARAIYQAGADPTELIVLASPYQQAVINKFTAFATVQIQRNDTSHTIMVNQIKTSFGNLRVVMSRWVRDTDIFIFDRNNLTIRTLRGLRYEPLAKTTDSDKGMIVMEKSLQVQAGNQAYWLKNLT